ncbi:MAG: S9 family peptidase [Gemmatimonadetes bacterium]|nr:S9 family peptidase [Gemmatimonadota bacterium]
MWIHGGPTSQFNDTFQQHVQFFADRGYAVLLPNIRGSSGYGKAFEDANNGCWGHCDLEDVLAGAEYLKALPYVDPDRIGITGTSYGGIMSMNAATFAPGAFQASIAASGYADWVHFYRAENELRHVKLLEYELGPFETSEQVWAASSSINAVSEVATPMFLLHGQGLYPGSDQTELFARALENQYKPFRYEVYEGETYYVGGRSNRRQMLLDMLAFFDQFLKDG